MKKFLLIIYSISLILLLIFTGCEKPEIRLASLYAPQNLKEENNIITWDEADNAAGYILDINGTEIDRGMSNQYALISSNIGQLIIKVKAVADGEYYNDSEFSEPITIVKLVSLSVPLNIRRSGNNILWNEVENAGGYIIKINEEEISVTVNQFSLRVTDTGSFTVMVKATGDNITYGDSAYSSTVSISPIKLDIPQNIKVVSGIIVWDEVINAQSYDVYCNNIFAENLAINNFTTNLSGDVKIKIKANAAGYESSDFSEEINCGEGSEYNPVFVSNEEQLKAIKNDLTNYYKLTADITLTEEWEIIGSTDTPFKGVLDGDNYQINNININTFELNAGIFGVIDGGKVINIKFGGSITAVNNNGIGYLGAVAGKFINGEISNVSVSINITAENYVTGGIIGRITDSTKTVNILKTNFQGTITVNGGADSYAGGLIGQMTSNYVIVSRCFADADISAPDIIGGFAGYLGSGNISDCYSLGNITANGAENVRVGGFIGHAEGYNIKVQRCYAAVSITGQGKANELKAGFTALSPSGTYGGNIYSDCYYNNTVADLDRIGSGRGDGILAKIETEFTSGTLFNNFSSEIWLAVTGSYPSLI